MSLELIELFSSQYILVLSMLLLGFAQLMNKTIESIFHSILVCPYIPLRTYLGTKQLSI